MITITKKRRFISLLVFVSLGMAILPACEKECASTTAPVYEDCPPVSIDYLECEPLPDHGSFISTFRVEDTEYTFPHYNPNNTEEFVYLERNVSEGKYDLVKYNMVYETKVILAENARVTSQPKWSGDNSIAYATVLENNISMVSGDGVDLTHLADNAIGGYPAWSPDGNKLYYKNSNFILRKDLIEDEIDTVFENNSSYIDISRNNNLYAAVFRENSKFLGNIDLDQSNYTSLLDLYDSQLISVLGLSPSPDGKYLYISMGDPESSGIYKMDLNTRLFTKIARSCSSKGYGSLSCSPDGRKLLVSRSDAYLEEAGNGLYTGTTIINRFISIIDLCSLVETTIELD